MKFEDFIEKVKAADKDKKICLSNSTFNHIIKESQGIQITEDGYLEFRHDKIRIKVSIKRDLYYIDDVVSHVEIIDIFEHDWYGRYKKAIFISPKVENYEIL